MKPIYVIIVIGFVILFYITYIEQEPEPASCFVPTSVPDHYELH